jgi:hypothetical protein
MKMKIKKIEDAENLIKNNKLLFWSGWDIVALFEDPSAYMNINGIFKDNVWYKKETYSLEEYGWDIPSKFIEAKNV